MRTFAEYPKGIICPLCGTDKDGECMLAGIDETEDGNNEEAQVIHTDCINLRFNRNVGIFYQRVKEVLK